MDPTAALAPFLGGDSLSTTQLHQVSDYLELLLKWNARINLTSLRSSDKILPRHFGESFFLARSVLGDTASIAQSLDHSIVIDLGSGAGFPGLPLKIYCPAMLLILIESQNKKATFLKEVVRTLKLTDIDVFSGRAEDYLASSPNAQPAALVTLRAVEHFARMLPIAAGLLAPAGRLALLIGSAQVAIAQRELPGL